MKARDIPNLISLARILLVAPTVYYLVNQDFKLALLLFFIAGISDGVDGFLARYYNWKSRLGTILDPLGDKLLLVSCYLALGWLEQLPVLLIVLVIVRDIFIVCGAIAYHMYIEEVSIKPLMISKLNTAVQILLVIGVIFSLSELPFSGWISRQATELLIWLVYFTTISSGLLYIWSWSQRALAVTKRGTKQ